MARPITAADLPPDLARFAEAQVAARRFESVEDVLRAGKDALEREQQRQERKLGKLRAAIAEGDASPDCQGNPFDGLRARHGLPPRPARRKSLAQLFAESPLKGLDLTFERDQDTGRPIGL